jgi:hypothetical protein
LGICFKPEVYYRDADYQSRDDKRQSRIGESITDGAFEAMMEAIQTDRTPNFTRLLHPHTNGE